jgi:glutaredoxin
MQRKILAPVLAVVFLALVFGFYYFRLAHREASTVAASTTNSAMILFVGEGCPHCAKVKDYVTTNKIDQKINIEEKEVWSNQDNENLMKQKATQCGITDYGVPFLWDNGTCTVGDQPVIDYFNKKLNVI